MQISVIFNFGDLTHYFEEDEEQNEDLRTNPLQGEGVEVEQVPNLGLLSLVMVLNQVCPILTILTWVFEKVQVRLEKVVG